MRLKLTAGLMAALVLPVLLASALAQTPNPDPRPRETRSLRSPDARSSVGPVIASDDVAPQDARVDWREAEVTTVPPVPGLYSMSPARAFSFASPARTAEEANYAREAEQLARKLGDAKSDSDRSKIKTELCQVLEKQFDLRQKRHLDEIKALEAKVKKLKDLVDKRQENRREIVSKRLDQIMSDAEGLGW